MAKEIQKLRERGYSDSETLDHLLETNGLTKPVPSEKSVEENSIRDKSELL